MMTISQAISLINKAIRLNVLQGEENKFVLVYRAEGISSPEGWYKSDIKQIAKELISDSTGLSLLQKATR